MRGKRANSRLHPNFSYVQIGIHAPGGKTIVYRPFMQNCAEPEPVYLDTANPSVYDSAYIGSGYDGFYFDHPGIYELRAVYHGPDGSKVYSNVLRLRVRAPMDRQENELAELFLGNDQAKLLYLLGSDSPSLNTGNQAFETVIDKYDQHPMAVYAKLVKGVNAARNFKHIDDHQVVVRPAKKEESAHLLSDVVRSSTAATEGAGATFD